SVTPRDTVTPLVKEIKTLVEKFGIVHPDQISTSVSSQAAGTSRRIMSQEDLQQQIDSSSKEAVLPLLNLFSPKELGSFIDIVMDTLSKYPPYARLYEKDTHNPFIQAELYNDPNAPPWCKVQLDNIFNCILGTLEWDDSIPPEVSTIISHTVDCLQNGNISQIGLTPECVGVGPVQFNDNIAHFYCLERHLPSHFVTSERSIEKSIAVFIEALIKLERDMQWYWNTTTPGVKPASPEMKDASLVYHGVDHNICLFGFEYKHGSNREAEEDIRKGRCDAARNLRYLQDTLPSVLTEDNVFTALTSTGIGARIHVRLTRQPLPESRVALTRSCGWVDFPTSQREMTADVVSKVIGQIYGINRRLRNMRDVLGVTDVVSAANNVDTVVESQNVVPEVEVEQVVITIVRKPARPKIAVKTTKLSRAREEAIRGKMDTLKQK
ncbi:hypothetical protein HDU93_008381, partial [Gonapodya sp. JEL0774]